jgi:hypothetical protein
MSLDDREQQLLNVGRDIRRFWRGGRIGLAGPNEIVFLERSLDRVLALYGDIQPVNDADRLEWANELQDRR